ncbi:MAG: HAMP domain-containing protein, partial [Hydrogenovibrio sp.]|uniref:HAMP domain-containing protein n=1 Tax=Hydrogenovibrio sp. TaxID=2065821 RepID=UPI002870785C
MNNLNISTRLILGFALILLLMVALVVIGLQRVNIIDNNMQFVGQVEAPKQRAAINFRGSVHDRAIALRDLVLTESESEAKQHLKDIKQLAKAYTQAEEKLQTRLDMSAISATEQKLIDRIYAIESEALPLTDRLIETRMRGEIDAARAFMSKETAGAYTEWLVRINAYIDFKEEAIATQVDEVETVATTFALIMVITTLVALMFAIFITFYIIRSIRRPINNLVESLTAVENQGNFNTRAAVMGNDELGILAESFNRFIAKTQTALKEVNTVVADMANGRFEKQVETDVVGDLGRLKQGVNESTQSVAETMSELRKLLKAMSEGKFDYRTKANVKGEYEELVNFSSTTMEDLDHTIDDIIHIMEKVDQGEFSERVTADAKGQLADLKNAINSSMEDLNEAFKEVTSVVVDQSNGDLTSRIKGLYKGDLNTLKNSVNETSDKLMEVVQKAMNATQVVADASSEVSQGSQDLSQRVQEQAASVEETSATMEQMNSAVQNNANHAKDATRVAHEVQEKTTEG